MNGSMICVSKQQSLSEKQPMQAYKKGSHHEILATEFH